MADDKRLTIEVGMEIEGLRRNIVEARKLTDNYTDFVKSQSKIQTQAEIDSSEKGASEIRKIRRQALSELDKNYKDAQEKAQGNAVELKKIDENYIKNKKNLYEQGEKDIVKATARWKDDVNDIIRQAGTENEQAVHQTKQKILADLEDQYKKEVSLARKAGESIADIQKQHAAQKSHIGAMPDAKQPSLPGFGGGVAGIVGKETVSSVQGLTSALGPLGNVMTGLGPGAILAGGAIAGLGIAMKNSLEAADEFHTATQKIKTLLTEEQELKLPAALEQLRKASMSTGAPLSELQSTMYNLISSVPVYASDLNAAAAASENAAKLGKALGASTDAVALAMGNMGNASGLNLASLEDQKFVMDALAETMNAGVIPSGEVLAHNIAKAAPALAQLTTNGREAVKMNGILTAAFTQNGLSTETAQDRMRDFANVLMDTAQRSDLLKAGLKGVSEAGKVTDLGALAESLSQDVGKYTSLVGSMQAADAMRLMAKNGGQSIKDLIGSFENMGGMAETMFSKMADTTTNNTDRMKAALNDIFLTMGQNGQEAMQGLAGVGADLLTTIDGWLQSAATKFKTAKGDMDSQKQMAAQAEVSLAKVNEALLTSDKVAPEKAAGVLSKLGIHLDEIAKKAGPAAAEAMKQILDSKGPLTEKLEKIKIQLQSIDAIAKNNQMGASIEAQTQAAEALEDTIKAQGTWWERNIGTIALVGEGIAGVMSAGVVPLIAGLTGVNDKLKDAASINVFERMQKGTEALEAKQTALLAKAQGGNAGDAETVKAWKEYGEVSKQILQQKNSMAAIDKGIADYAKQSLDAQMQYAHGEVDKVDAEKAYQDALGRAMAIMPEIAQAPEYQKKLREEITASLEPMKQKYELENNLQQIAMTSGQAQQDALIKTLAGKTDEKTITELINSAKEKGLEIEGAINTAATTVRDAKLADLQSRASHNELLTEAEAKELGILEAEKSQAQAKAAILEFQNNKNSLLISEAALQKEIGDQVDGLINNQAISYEQKKAALELMIEQNNAEIYSLSLVEHRTAAQEAEIENLRTANNVIKEKLKGITNADHATKLMSDTEKQAAINNLKNIKAENEARINVFKNALTGIMAIIKGESLHGKALNDVIKAQNELNKAKGVSIQGTIGEVKNAEAMKAAIEAEIGKLTSANTEIDKNIATLQKQNIVGPQTKHAGGGGGGGQSAEDKAKKDADELKKIMDAYRKAIQKAEDDYRNEMRKIAFEREKLRINERVEGMRQAEALRKHGEDRAKAERDIARALEDFAINLKNKVDEFNKAELAQVSQKLSGLLTPLQLIEIEYNKLLDIQRKAVKGFQGDIAAREKDLKEQREIQKTQAGIQLEKGGQGTELKALLGDLSDKNLKFLADIALAKKAEAEAQATYEKDKKLYDAETKKREEFANTQYKKAALLLTDAKADAIERILPQVKAAKTLDDAVNVVNDNISGIPQEVYDIGASIKGSWSDYFAQVIKDFKNIPASLPKYRPEPMEPSGTKRSETLEAKRQTLNEGTIVINGIKTSNKELLEQQKEYNDAEKAAQGLKEAAENKIIKLEGELLGLREAENLISKSQEADLAEIVFRLKEYQTVQKNIANIQDQINREINPETRAHLQAQLNSEYALLKTIQSEEELEGQLLEKDKTKALGLVEQIKLKKIDADATAEQKDAYYKAESLVKNITDLTGDLAKRQTDYTESIIKAKLQLYFIAEATKEIDKIQKDTTLTEIERQKKLAIQYEALNKLLNDRLNDSIEINEANKKEEAKVRARYEAGQALKADLDKAVKNTQDSTKAVNDNTKAIDDNTKAKDKNAANKPHAAMVDEEKEYKTTEEHENKEYELLKRKQTQEKLLFNIREAQHAKDKQASLEARQAEIQRELETNLNAEDRKKLQDEYNDNKAKALDLEKSFAEAVKNSMKGAADELEIINTLVTESITEIQGIITNFKGKNVGEAVAGIGTTTKKIGQSLMNFPDASGTIPAIGAAMFLGGEITEIVGKIISSFKKHEKTQAEINQEALDTNQKKIDSLKRQKEILEKQISMGKVDLDQAWEKYNALELQLANMEKQLGISHRMSQEDADRQKQNAEDQKKYYEDQKAAAEKLKEGSRADRKDFLISSGFRSDIAPGEDTKEILENYITWLDQQVQKYGQDADQWSTYSDEIGNATEQLGQIIQETKTVSAGVVEILKSQNVTGAQLTNALNLSLDAQRAMLEDSLKGVKDLSGMTNEQIKSWAATFGQYTTAQLEAWGYGPTEIAAINEFLGVEKKITDEKKAQIEAIAKGDEAKRKDFAHRKKELDYLYSMGLITETERKTRLTAILNEELLYEQSIYDQMVAQHASSMELADEKEKIWDLEKEIYATIHDQNGLQDEQLKKVKALNMERNQMLMAMKLGGGDAGQLAAIEDQIITALKDAGASEEQIQMQLATFRNTMPRYAQGTQGSRTQEGVAFLHKGEAIINPKGTAFLDSAIPGFIDSINRGPDLSLLEAIANNYYRSKEALTSRTNVGQSSNTTIEFGDIIINIPQGNDPQKIAQVVRKEIEKTFTGRGIQLGGL